MKWILLIVILVVVVIFILIYSMDNKKSSSKRWKLERLLSSGPVEIESLMYHYRPYNHDNPSNYYGIFTLNSNTGYTLNVSSPGYYEVCIYQYPLWEIVYSETNINEIHLDSLPDGEYVVIIHSFEEVKGSLERTGKRKRSLPEQRLHLHGNSSVFDEVGEMYEYVVKLQENFGLNPTKDDFTSIPLTRWPQMRYTREEFLKFHPRYDICVVIISNSAPILGCEEGTIIAQSKNLIAYQFNENKLYNIHQIYSNIEVNEEVLPFYIYTFN